MIHIFNFNTINLLIIALIKSGFYACPYTNFKKIQRQTIGSLERLNKMRKIAKDLNFIVFFQKLSESIPESATFLSTLDANLNKEEKAKALHNWMKESTDLLASITNLSLAEASTGCLWEVPEEILLFIHLEKINLNNQQLIGFPQIICQLSNLQELYLNNMHGGSYFPNPDCIGQLTNLQVLDLGGCLLREIPKNLEQLINLRKLDLSYNCIQIAEEISNQFRHVQHVYIHTQDPHRPKRNLLQR